LLEELERLEMPADIREARLETLRREAAEFAAMHEKQHGQYTYVDGSASASKTLQLRKGFDICVFI